MRLTGAIGEDIVMTCRLMQNVDRVLFEPTAVAFTDVPENVRHFMRQRTQWARGKLEGIATTQPWRQSRRLSGLIAIVDVPIPLLLSNDQHRWILTTKPVPIRGRVFLWGGLSEPGTVRSTPIASRVRRPPESLSRLHVDVDLRS